MSRVPYWERRLAEYINENRDRPFQWGVFDCLTWVNGSHKVLTGEGFADKYLGYSNLRGAKLSYARAARDLGVSGWLGVMDTRFQRCERVIPRGSIVARPSDRLCTGYGLGVCIGSMIAFPGVKGLVFDERVTEDTAWIVE